LTWTERTSSGERYWYSVTSSSDGTVREVGYQTDAANAAVSYACGVRRLPLTHASLLDDRQNLNLQKLAAVDLLGSIYTSTNSGATWTARATEFLTPLWFSIAGSDDGTVRQG